MLKPATLTALSIISFSLPLSAARTDVSNLTGFRVFEAAEDRINEDGVLWIPTASDIDDDSGTFADEYLAKTVFHRTSWSQSNASAATESRKLATRSGGSDFRSSTTTFVNINVSDELFFTRPNDPGNQELIPITLKFDVGFNLPNAAYPEKPGSVSVGDDTSDPGLISLFGIAAENEGENISDASFGEKTFEWTFLYETDFTGAEQNNFGFGMNEVQLLVEPGDEVILIHELYVEHRLGYVLLDPQEGQSLNAGGGVRANLRVWIEVADDIALESNSGHDYLIEPTAIESADEVWGGYLLVDGAWVETGNPFGWLNVVNAPWVWSLNTGRWMYLPEESLLNQNGFWTYIIR